MNSRGRPHHLSELCRSVVNSTLDLSNIELLAGLDTDDPLADSIRESIGPYLAFSRLFLAPRPPNLIHSLNTLAGHAQGKYILILNDDVVFITKNWDEIAWEKLEKYTKEKGDEIVYGQTFDISADKDPGGEYSAFPILSKKACEILGFAIPPEFFALGGDVACYRIYETIRRICPLKDIILDHVLHNTVEKVLKPDQTAYEFRQMTYQNRMDWKTFNIDEYTTKLLNYINGTAK